MASGVKALGEPLASGQGQISFHIARTSSTPYNQAFADAA